MATKKEQDRKNDQWLPAIAAFIFIPFLVVAVRHYKRMQKRFPPTATSQRIFDTLNLLPPLSAGSACVIGTLGLIYYASGWFTGTKESNHEDTQKTFHSLAASFERQDAA
jgi:hypothetical protein